MGYSAAVAVTGSAAGTRGAASASGPVVDIILSPPPPPPAPPPGTPQRRFPIPPTLAGLNKQTVRMIVRASIGGTSVRARISNAVGGASVSLGAAHIAIGAKDSAIISPMCGGPTECQFILLDQANANGPTT